MPLYRVDISTMILVAAKDEAEAVANADRYASQEIFDNGAEEVHATEIKSPDEIPDGWKGACAYGSNNLVTEILAGA